MSDAPRSFEVSVSPRVLKWARESAGVSVEWAAHHVGKPAQHIEAWERGQGKPTYAALRSLGELYRRPLSVLLLPEPPPEPDLPTDRRSFAGIEPQPLSFDSLLALRDAYRLRAVAGDIYDALRLRVAVRIESVHVTDIPEQVAGEERGRLGVSLVDQFGWSTDGEAWSSWRRAVEGLGVLVFQFRMPVRELRGFALSAGGEPPAVVVSGRDRIRPRMFTLFHEYAHLLLGAGSLCLPSPTAVRRRSVEGFCNRFAGALLVPGPALHQEEAANRLRGVQAFADEALYPLTSRFRASRYVLLERLRREGLVSEEAYRNKWAQWSPKLEEWSEAEGGRGPLPPQRALVSRGPRFASLLLEAADRGIVSYADLSDYLGVRSRHFDAIAAAASESPRSTS